MLSTTENMYSSNWGSLPHFDKNVFFFQGGGSHGSPSPSQKDNKYPCKHTASQK